MAKPTVPNGEEHFFPVIYEGNGSGQRVGKFMPFTDNGTIANSLIFNDDDSPYMRRTPSGASNRKTFTVSFWVKRGKTGVLQVICTQGSDHNNATVISFDSSNRFKFSHNDSGSATYTVTTNRTFEDVSKFYHLLASVDTTQSTASDRVKLYVDGDLITSFASSSYPSQDFDLDFNSTGTIAVSGQIPSGTLYPFDGYLAEINLVDGTALTPDTFGLTDTSTGRWIPKALTGITYGTNGFRLQFASSSNLGDDTGGNNHDFSVTNLVAGDQTTDTPTKNFPTLDRFRSALTESEGNTVGTSTGTGVRFAFSTMTFDPSDSTGYYMEFKLLQATYAVCGFRSDTSPLPLSTSTTYVSDGYIAINYADDLYQDGTNVYNGSDTYSNNDIIGFYIKELNLYYSINGVMQNSSNPIGTFSKPGRYRITVGHNANYSPYASVQIICPQSKWTYTPSGDFANYREISQDNLPETDKGISGLVWIKSRDTASAHMLFDSTRGPQLRLKTDSTSAESLSQGTVTKFLKGGYAVGDQTSVNKSGDSTVSWNWVANGGTTASNGDGSISSTVQANTSAGFSIVKYTGTGSAGTVGHGLSSAPEWIFGRPIEQTGGYNWSVYHKSMTSASYYLSLNLNTAESSNSNVWGTAPSSSVISVGTSMSASTEPMILYCWHGVDGFSKFGKYTGTGSNPGPFIYTGFKVRWLMHKANNAASWYIYDTVRNQNNPLLFPLFADTTSTESSNVYGVDFFSNGFQLKQPTGYGANYSGVDVFYMAFAEHPFVGDGTNPVTAK